MLLQVAALELDLQHLQDVQQDAAEHAVSPEALQRLEQQVSTLLQTGAMFTQAQMKSVLPGKMVADRRQAQCT